MEKRPNSSLMQKAIQHPGILILAAGESKRLGTPKQLLQYEGESLINRLIGRVKAAGNFPIALVLGAHAAEIKDQLAFDDIHLLMNHEWKEGMASSIQIGVTHFMDSVPTVDGLLLLVCDQPFVEAQILLSLLELQRNSGLPIAACSYNQILGTPAVFHNAVFPDLLGLKGDTGARKIINCNSDAVASLQFEKAMFDIDTMDDFRQLMREN